VPFVALFFVFKKTLSKTVTPQDQFNKFNPNCLRTKRQIQKYNVSKYSPWFGDSQLADAVDEMCFASAAWARPLSLVSVLVLAAATLFLVL
jgi:hypothetical protein